MNLNPIWTAWTLLYKTIRIFLKEGPARLGLVSYRFSILQIRSWWDRSVRPRLPERTVTYNGVAVPNARLSDGVVPWYTTDRPEYEVALLRSIRECVSGGDEVIVVGGGWGVSSVVAARRAGPDGRVTTFEGATEMAVAVEETASLNGVADHVDTRHAVVGRAIEIDGEPGDPEQVPPADLPACDVLVLDCEGAELTILRELAVSPRAIVVESHGLYDSPTAEVESALDGQGYTVEARGLAEVETVRHLMPDWHLTDVDLRGHCREADVRVLRANRGETA